MVAAPTTSPRALRRAPAPVSHRSCVGEASKGDSHGIPPVYRAAMYETRGYGTQISLRSRPCERRTKLSGAGRMPSPPGAGPVSPSVRLAAWQSSRPVHLRGVTSNSVVTDRGDRDRRRARRSGVPGPPGAGRGPQVALPVAGRWAAAGQGACRASPVPPPLRGTCPSLCGRRPPPGHLAAFGVSDGAGQLPGLRARLRSAGPRARSTVAPIGASAAGTGGSGVAPIRWPRRRRASARVRWPPCGRPPSPRRAWRHRPAGRSGPDTGDEVGTAGRGVAVRRAGGHWTDASWSARRRSMTDASFCQSGPRSRATLPGSLRSSRWLSSR